MARFVWCNGVLKISCRSFAILYCACNLICHKRQQGDKRTPSGSYTFDYKNKKSKFCGSIHVSYCTTACKACAKKTGVNAGTDIMIHGQKMTLVIWHLSINYAIGPMVVSPLLMMRAMQLWRWSRLAPLLKS